MKKNNVGLVVLIVLALPFLPIVGLVLLVGLALKLFIVAISR